MYGETDKNYKKYQHFIEVNINNITKHPRAKQFHDNVVDDEILLIENGQNDDEPVWSKEYEWYLGQPCVSW